MLGKDVDARNWNRMLARAALPPLLLTLALVAILFTGSVLLTRRSRIAGEQKRWLSNLEPALAFAVGLA